MIRGEDHLSNTPKHILLFRALGSTVPQFAHLPLILNPDRTKMSKRKSQTAMDAYRAEGFVKEAIVNFLAFLGWSPGTEEEIFTLEELGERFDARARPELRGAVFDRSVSSGSTASGSAGSADDDLADRLLPFLVHRPGTSRPKRDRGSHANAG